MTTPPQTEKGNTKRTLVSQTQVYIKIGKSSSATTLSETISSKGQDQNKRSLNH